MSVASLFDHPHIPLKSLSCIASRYTAQTELPANCAACIQTYIYLRVASGPLIDTSRPGGCRDDSNGWMHYYMVEASFCRPSLASDDILLLLTRSCRAAPCRKIGYHPHCPN